MISYQINRIQTEVSYLHQANNSFDLFTRVLPKNSDILDLGCGSGVEFSYDSHTIEQFKDLIRKVSFVITSEVMLNKADGYRDKGRIGFVLQKS